MAVAAAKTREARVVAFECPPVVRAFINDTAPITGFFGPLGCSKTTAGCWKVWRFAQRYPGSRILIVRETWPALRDTTQKTFFKWFPDRLFGRHEKTTNTFWLVCMRGEERMPDAEVLFRGLDDEEDIKRVLSLDLSAAWIDEPQGGIALREDAGVTVDPGVRRELFEALYARVGRGPEVPAGPGQIWLTGNPPAPSHWIAREFEYDGRGEPRPVILPLTDAEGRPLLDAEGRPRLVRERMLYLGTRATNREHLPDGYYERLERQYGLGTPMTRRFLNGEWIDFAAEKPFQREWICRAGLDEAPRIPPIEELNVAIGIDPAISQEKDSAYSAIVCAGQVLGGRHIFILDAQRGHWSVWEQVDRLLRMARKYQARTIRIEDVAYQKALAEIIERQLRESGTPLYVDPVKPDLNKLRRAMAWSPFVQDGTIVFAPGLGDLIDAMLAVPQDRRQWDYVDAAGLCVRGFPVRAAESEPIPTPERRAAANRAISYVHQARPTPAHQRVWRGHRPGLSRAAGYIRPLSGWRR